MRDDHLIPRDGKDGTILFTLVLDMDITESSGYKDFLWAVELHRLGLEMLGLWPKSDKFTEKKLWTEIRMGIILILLIFVSNIPMICAILRAWGDTVFAIDTLRTSSLFLMSSVKYIIMRWKQTVLSSMVNMMAEDWVAFKLNAERDVMIRRARTARLIMIVGYIVAVMGSIILIIPPCFGIQVIHVMNLTGRSKMLPMQMYHFYNVNKSPQFELTFSLQTITCFVAPIVYMSVDFFLLLTIFHICGQLENFKHRLVTLISCRNFDRALNNIIATHSRLIRFANDIENTYSLMMLISVFHFVIAFCLSGFLFVIVLIDRKIDEVIIAQINVTVIIVIALLMNTFFYCGAGELVTEHCDAAYRAICDLEWYKLESRKARNLILLMIRANYPFRITAGKIIPLTMATFCNILKTSAGYISFLLAKHTERLQR